MKKSFLLPLILFVFSANFAAGGEIQESNMKLFSPAFREGETLPEKYTCDGKNISPALNWEAAPKGTQSLALLVEDPDAPMGLWVHWVLFNIPPTIHNLPEGLPGIRSLANGERHGINSSRKLGYDGPCPPSGTHRYYFKLYALDNAPVLDAGIDRAQLLKALEGHVLAGAELMGRYQRKK